MALPLFKAMIDPSAGSDFEVDYVALVDRPAIEKNFLAFEEVQKRFAFNEEKQIISGPAMLAGVPIYRRDPDLGEYNVVFDRDTLTQIVQKFFALGYNQNFNIMHDPSKKTEGVFIFESFQVDRERGIMPMKGFEDAQDGSWFISAKVDNANVWSDVKAGKFKGFSIEGVFKLKKIALSEEQVIEQMKELLKSLDV